MCILSSDSESLSGLVPLTDIPSDLPFADWARIFHDRPAYPLSVLKKTAFKDNPLAALFRCLLYLQATKQRILESANALLRAYIALF